MCSRQYEETKTELSDLKEKYERAEQEKRALAEELDDCKANMKDMEEKGTKVRANLSQDQQKTAVLSFSTLTVVTTKLRDVPAAFVASCFGSGNVVKV